MVRLFYWSHIGCEHWLIEWVWISLESAVGSIWVVGDASNCSDHTTLRWVEESAGVLFSLCFTLGEVSLLSPFSFYIFGFCSFALHALHALL